MDFCKIFVVSHKDFKIPRDKLYEPIQVGNNANIDGCKYRDNSGDNISKKNPHYCELTAVYWLWKNLKNTENIGICHYRRYFSKHNLLSSEKYFISEDEVKSVLTQYDAIVPQKLNILGSVKEFYYVQGEGKKKDIDKTVEIISKKYPEYMETLTSVLASKSAYYCNMVILSKEKFDEYCQWLFDILFELESEADLSEYSTSEARIYGYISEILLNVWIEKNNLRVMCLPVINTEQTFLVRLKKMIQNKVKGIYNMFF